MDWTRQIDGYCERTDPGYWSEPWNALTNVAFLLAALWMWRACAGVPAGRLLAVLLCAIGVGSFLFHTHATAWAGIADVVPIGLFILVYLYLVNRDVVGLKVWSAGLVTAIFLPYAAGVAVLLQRFAFFRHSAGYWAVPLLIFLYALGLARRAPRTARDLALGGLLLSISITLRSLDAALCPVWPIGTHLFWHVLNAIMLGWMIEVYRRFRDGMPAE